jgi:hypothetical protein
MGVVDDEGYLLWVGVWRGTAAALLGPAAHAPHDQALNGQHEAPSGGASGGTSGDAISDELDVPMAVVREHVRVLRAPLQASSLWMPLQTADGERQLLRELRPGEEPRQPQRAAQEQGARGGEVRRRSAKKGQKQRKRKARRK